MTPKVRLETSYDDKTNSKSYILTKKLDSGETAMITVIDFDNKDKNNTDGVIVNGKTSIFTNVEVKSLLEGYNNTATGKTKLPNEEHTLDVASGRIDFKEGKVYNLGSFAQALGINPAPAAPATTTPSYVAPNFPTLNTGMPYMDTSIYDGAGTIPNAVGPGKFDSAKAQEAMNTYSSIGALFGMLSTLGGDCDFLSSLILPMMMSSSLPDFGNFFTPQAVPNTNTNTNSNTNTGAANTPAPSNTTVNTTTTSNTTPSNTTANNTASNTADIVANTEKQYKALQTEKVAENQTEKSKNGNVVTKNQAGNKVVQKFKNGTKIEETEYYSDGSFNRINYSEIKGATYQKGETVGINKDGQQIRKYTDPKDGSRVVETRKNGKLTQTDIYNTDGSSKTILPGKTPIENGAPGGVFRYVDDAHLLSYVQCLDDDHLKRFFFGQ